MYEDIPLEEMTRRGAMTKSPFKMAPDKYAAWQRHIQRQAPACLFSIGQPLLSEENGKVMAEYADGHTRCIG